METGKEGRTTTKRIRYGKLSTIPPGKKPPKKKKLSWATSSYTGTNNRRFRRKRKQKELRMGRSGEAKGHKKKKKKPLKKVGPQGTSRVTSLKSGTPARKRIT